MGVADQHSENLQLVVHIAMEKMGHTHVIVERRLVCRSSTQVTKYEYFAQGYKHVTVEHFRPSQGSDLLHGQVALCIFQWDVAWEVPNSGKFQHIHFVLRLFSASV